MSDRSDYVKSLVRGFAAGASRRLAVPLQTLHRAVRSALAQASSIPDRRLAQVLTRVEGVGEASVVCREERIWVEATSIEGLTVRFNLEPAGARFAPRGAKEVLFRVEPAELAGKAFSRDLIGAIGAMVAHTLWGPLLGHATPVQYDAIAERDGSEVRIDLRTVPAVRRAMQRGLGQLFDALELGRIEVLDGSLRLHLKLPRFSAP